MTRWKQDTTEFQTKINYHDNGSGNITAVCRIPRPIIENMGNPNELKFVVMKNNVRIEAVD